MPLDSKTGMLKPPGVRKISLKPQPLVVTSEGCPVDPTMPVPPPAIPYPAAAASSKSSASAPMPSIQAAMTANRLVGTEKVVDAVPFLNDIARNPEFLVFEQTFRIFPDESWYSPERSANNVAQFELGAIRPGQNIAICVFDIEVTPYRFGGTDALDYQPVTPGRISGSFGYSVKINGQTPGNLKYSIAPLASTLDRLAIRLAQNQSGRPKTSTSSDFARAQAEAFAASSGSGGSIHAQNGERIGNNDPRYTEWIFEDGVLDVRGFVFAPVGPPLAFIETRLTGYQTSTTLLSRLKSDLSSLFK